MSTVHIRHKPVYVLQYPTNLQHRIALLKTMGQATNNLRWTDSRKCLKNTHCLFAVGLNIEDKIHVVRTYNYF